MMGASASEPQSNQQRENQQRENQQRENQQIENLSITTCPEHPSSMGTMSGFSNPATIPSCSS
jgi:hypothetical protein